MDHNWRWSDWVSCKIRFCDHVLNQNEGLRITCSTGLAWSVSFNSPLAFLMGPPAHHIENDPGSDQVHKNEACRNLVKYIEPTYPSKPKNCLSYICSPKPCLLIRLEKTTNTFHLKSRFASCGNDWTAFLLFSETQQLLLDPCLGYHQLPGRSVPNPSMFELTDTMAVSRAKTFNKIMYGVQYDPIGIYGFHQKIKIMQCAIF